MSSLLDQKREQRAKWFKIGIVAAVALVVSPIIFAVVKGLIGLLIAGVIGLTAVQLAPWFAMKLANASLKLIKNEATENPIETRQNISRTNWDNLKSFENSITEFQGEVNTFADKVKQLKKQLPEEADEYEAQLDTMEQLLAIRRSNYKEAKRELEGYDEETKKLSIKWDMAVAAHEMNKKAGNFNGPNPLDEIKNQAANDSVSRKMNTAMAALQTSLMTQSISAPKVAQIQQKQPSVIDITPLTTKSKGLTRV